MSTYENFKRELEAVQEIKGPVLPFTEKQVYNLFGFDLTDDGRLVDLTYENASRWQRLKWWFAERRVRLGIRIGGWIAGCPLEDRYEW